MMCVNSIVGLILPVWIADILPGKNPVHTSDGNVEPNFKSRVLKAYFEESKHNYENLCKGIYGSFSFKFWRPAGHEYQKSKIGGRCGGEMGFRLVNKLRDPLLFLGMPPSGVVF